MSLLFDDCLNMGRDVSDGGAIYNLSSISEAGTITAANSLYAVKRAVYVERKVSVEALNQALAANFQGQAALQAWLANRVPKFGNDEDEIDLFARDVVRLNQRVIDELGVYDYRGGRIVTGSGISTAWAAGHWTGATPDGRLAVSRCPSAWGRRPERSVRAPRPC